MTEIPTLTDPLACWLLGLHYQRISDPTSYVCKTSGVTSMEIIGLVTQELTTSEIHIDAADVPQVLKVYDHLPVCKPCTLLERAYLCSSVCDYRLPPISDDIFLRPIQRPAHAVLFLHEFIRRLPRYDSFDEFCQAYFQRDSKNQGSLSKILTRNDDNLRVHF
jgi:hypothetical protein